MELSNVVTSNFIGLQRSDRFGNQFFSFSVAGHFDLVMFLYLNEYANTILIFLFLNNVSCYDFHVTSRGNIFITLYLVLNVANEYDDGGQASLIQMKHFT